jgi:hypothetical protein
LANLCAPNIVCIPDLDRRDCGAELVRGTVRQLAMRCGLRLSRRTPCAFGRFAVRELLQFGVIELYDALERAMMPPRDDVSGGRYIAVNRIGGFIWCANGRFPEERYDGTPDVQVHFGADLGRSRVLHGEALGVRGQSCLSDGLATCS